jgi:large subunit ribosomal protein L18
MSEIKIKSNRQKRRLARTRKKLRAVSELPRLSVMRSNKHIYAQIIDDVKGKTLVAVHEKELPAADQTKVVRAGELGKILAEKAKSAKVAKVMFDKGSYRYHGRVKAFAMGAREGGLEF